MLKKLLKYDLENVYKVLIVFYILALFFALSTRILLNIENSFILNIIGQICSGVTVAMIINILINSLMRMWVRFKSNLYGDESYLTHTLPIDKKTLYLSKFITALILMFTGILVIALTLLIAYYSKENIELLKSFLLPISNYSGKIIKVLLALLFIFFLEFSNALQSGYTGIILGHKMNNSKTMFSVLYGFITYIIIQVFTLLSIFVLGLFNKDVMNLFITNEIVSMSMLKTLIYIAIIIYSLTLIIGYFVNNKLFKKGVNVE